MTKKKFDFVISITPLNGLKTLIKTANGNVASVEGARAVQISHNLSLQNCLFVPNLNYKLWSISQMTKELNCTVLLTSYSCIVQDAWTGRIIARGTKRDGLYHLNAEIQKGNATLAHGSLESQAWTWHRRLGHPLIGYLKRLFPSLASLQLDFNCEPYILEKSHKHSYPISFNKTDKPFVLFHSDI